VDAGEGVVRIDVVRDLAQLARLRESWRALIALSPSTSAFVTWEWLYSWAERFVRGPRRLFVVAIYSGSHLVGLAPWYIDRVQVGPFRVRQLGFLGLPEAGSDYLEVVAAKGKDKLVAQALVTLLYGRLAGAWDVLSLSDIPSDSRFLARFLTALRHAGKHYAVADGSFCPCVVLPATFEEYLGGLSSHARQAYRRKLRRLHAMGAVTHDVLKEPGEVEAGLAGFQEMYERRWRRSQGSHELFELVASYLAKPERVWRVELDFLRIDGRAVAGLVHLVRDRVVNQYLMAVDRSFKPTLSIGSLLCGMSIERAIQAKAVEYDFLKSAEDYKMQFMSGGRRGLNLTVHNRTARGLAAYGIRAAQHGAKMLLR
jgi:CelD/BcsL family acetyltransferase involved in cellulose biosynthesis